MLPSTYSLSSPRTLSLSSHPHCYLYTVLSIHIIFHMPWGLYFWQNPLKDSAMLSLGSCLWKHLGCCRFLRCLFNHFSSLLILSFCLTLSAVVGTALLWINLLYTQSLGWGEWVMPIETLLINLDASIRSVGYHLSLHAHCCNQA